MPYQHLNTVSRESSPLRQSSNDVDELGRMTQNLRIDRRQSAAAPNISPARALSRHNSLSVSPNGRQPPGSPLRSPSVASHRSPSSASHRSPSSASHRSSTPLMRRQPSMNSMNGGNGITPSRSSSTRRASSAQFSNASTMVGKSPIAENEDPIPALPKHTAASVARNHFQAELDSHNKENNGRNADTIVVLHDACYGHRYSRPRTSKTSLATIVERPERIHASILGLSVAYVCLGERHADGQYPPHPKKDPSELPAVPFKIRKTTRQIPLSSQAVTNVHGVKWMEELKIMCDNAESRLAMNGKELTRPDIPRGSGEAPAHLHEGDLFLCSESLNAMEGSLGAVCEGVDAVFQGSATGKGPHRAFVVIRPPGHHCSANYPSGFCWVNNVHVGISHAALTHGLTHAAIIDFDLHHGDGSQAIAWENNKRASTAAKNSLPWKKTSIGYFSLHDINSYPCEMGDEEKVKNASLCIENAHGQSIWNVHLQPWKSEQEFWELYETKYSVLLEKTRSYLRSQTERLRLLPNGPKPKGAIFLSAGFDASEWESSGMQRHKVNVPTEFYARLTRDVVRIAAEEGTGVDGRVISVLEGGYSDRALCTGVMSHLSGMTAGDAIVIQKELSPHGLGYEMGQKIGTFDGHEKRESVTLGKMSYEPTWWSVQRLEQLDAVVHPLPAIEAKKVRDMTPPTFSSPTASFIAKITSPAGRRSVSNIDRSPPRPGSRPPSPPPPEVDWTVAAHELSKLLIPTDRQTMSCQPEELASEASKKRQSMAPPIAAIEGNKPGMALRVRKPARPITETVQEDEVKKPARSDRRKTVAGSTLLTAETAISRSTTPVPVPVPVPVPSYARASRRSSIASTTGSGFSEAQAPVGRGRVVSNRITSIGQRPGTSQSARPDSAASVRGSMPPLPNKKTRQPAQPKTEVLKTSRGPKISPDIASITESFGKQSLDSKEEGALPTKAAPTLKPKKTSKQSPPTESVAKSKVEEIAESLEKNNIGSRDDVAASTKPGPVTKLKRGPKQSPPAALAAKTNVDEISDHFSDVSVSKPATKRVPKAKPSLGNNALEEPAVNTEITKKPRLIIHNRNGLKATDLPSTPPASDTASKSSAISSEVDALSESSIPDQELPLPVFSNNRLQHAAETALPPSSPPKSKYFSEAASTESSSRPSSSSGTAVDEITIIQHQPDGPPAMALPVERAIHFLPPNTNTPSPMKNWQGHGFTATSAIPFAPNGLPKQDVKIIEPSITKENESGKEVNIWEVLETPDKR